MYTLELSIANNTAIMLHNMTWEELIEYLRINVDHGYVCYNIRIYREGE